MLSVAYVLLLEDLARDVHAHTVAAAIAAALGAQQTGGDRPDWDAVREQFDIDLAEPPAQQRPEWDSTKQIKLRALGLA